MSQLDRVVATLKAQLKQRQMTYNQLASELNMSEANIKRMFSQKQFSLARLEEICTVLSLTMSDLFLLIEHQTEKLSSLTAEQEQELIDNPKLFLVAACVRDGWSFDEIIQYYQVEQLECVQLLAKLDRLKMIQLLPDNQYKVLIAQDFHWLPNGPLEQFMEKEGLTRFMESSFVGDNSFRFYMRGTYTQSTIDLIQRKLNQLKKDVAQLNQEDAKLPLSNRQHIGLLFAMRPWELPIFKALRR
ncbi:helix-turn-helix transcriptional regulator [Thalassotalea sp. LPB0316]|uniref:helix-turn-helix domain-containing protein n=1 Tax=Thalassotalea sp. LPB0316 TaxID=2769490 RepID=UPI0018675517|nr:helix-turn-helix transcriptional regulator [Thalassotalea sp. LPB0316]QOL25614.1 helix-turn-helix transcriptional regulator [Thalassotalea sp. LPB0316]